jgi:hypothetical protein
MRAFSGYFANIADHLGNTGCLTNKMPPDLEFPDSEEVELWFFKATDAKRRAGTADKQWLAVPCPLLRYCG